MTASDSAAPTPQGSRSPVGYVLRLLSSDRLLLRTVRWRAARRLEKLGESQRTAVFQALAERGTTRQALVDLGADERELVLAGVDRERCQLCKHFAAGMQVPPVFDALQQHLSPDEIASAEREDIVEEQLPDGSVRGQLNHRPSDKTRETLEDKPHSWNDYGTCGLEGDVGVHADAPCGAFGTGGRFA